MIFRHIVYNAQFSFVTIYKVGKCVMPSVLKICSDCKSCVGYSSLNSNHDDKTGHFNVLRILKINIQIRKHILTKNV